MIRASARGRSVAERGPAGPATGRELPSHATVERRDLGIRARITSAGYHEGASRVHAIRGRLKRSPQAHDLGQA